MISQKKGPETKKCVHFLGLANSQPFPLWKEKKKKEKKEQNHYFNFSPEYFKVPCLLVKNHTRSSGNFSSDLKVIFLSENVKLNGKQGS